MHHVVSGLQKLSKDNVRITILLHILMQTEVFENHKLIAQLSYKRNDCCNGKGMIEVGSL